MCLMRRSLLVVVVACTSVATARASQTEATSEPSPVVAAALSLGGTAAAWSLTYWSFRQLDEGSSRAFYLLGVSGVAVVIGPALGHVYAGPGGAAVPGLVLRSTGLGLYLGGLVTAVAMSATAQSKNETTAGFVIAKIGVGVLALGTIYDWFATPISAARQRRLAVAPAPFFTSSAAGLGFVGTF